MVDIKLLKKYSENLNVLYVEDDQDLNNSVAIYLNKFFNHVEVAFDGKDGLKKYNSSSFDIVLSDINMPIMNGIEMITAIKNINSEQNIIVISAHTEAEYLLETIHLGISEYILKPIIYEQVNSILFKVVHNIHINQQNINYSINLENMLEDKTQYIKENYELTVHAMVELVETRDTYTGGHSDRVANYSMLIAKEMNLSDKECDLIYRAGMLHDIGKVTTPDAILLKPGKLTPSEYHLIKNHVTVSYDLLSKIPMYDEISTIVATHHERHDGNGYPNGLSGSEIPLLGRIMIIADSFDAMTTNRIYKGRITPKNAIKEIESLSGSQFDPEIVPAACKALLNVELDDTITQLPKGNMEDERFAYFFHDPLTHQYNKDYLKLFIQSISDDTQYYTCVNFLRNFSQYNKKHGWDNGDKLIQEFSNYLSEIYPDVKQFRIHGDTFILISDKPLDIAITTPSAFDNTSVNIESRYIELSDNFFDHIRDK
ncbi:response regulator [Sulfurimonas sp.]|nr:response regulator [Sulfurimonas sp.]